MSRYQHLPVFQASYDLVLEIQRRVENFPRAHRYSVGEKLKLISFNLLDGIIEANSVRDKVIFLKKVIRELEKLKIYIRICFDLKIIGAKGFEYLVVKMDEIGRQLNKWNDWSLKTNKN